MKTYIIRSHTFYGTIFHIINAHSMEEASQLADVGGVLEGFTIEEVDTTSYGIVETLEV